jgi:hypothetical protein
MPLPMTRFTWTGRLSREQISLTERRPTYSFVHLLLILHPLYPILNPCKHRQQLFTFLLESHPPVHTSAYLTTTTGPPRQHHTESLHALTTVNFCNRITVSYLTPSPLLPALTYQSQCARSPCHPLWAPLPGSHTANTALSSTATSSFNRSRMAT